MVKEFDVIEDLSPNARLDAFGWKLILQMLIINVFSWTLDNLPNKV